MQLQLDMQFKNYILFKKTCDPGIFLNKVFLSLCKFMTVLSRTLDGQKYKKKYPVSSVPITVDLQVIINEVLGKYKILSCAYKIIISNSAHTITIFRVFVINIIKMNLDWKNCHHF